MLYIWQYYDGSYQTHSKTWKTGRNQVVLENDKVVLENNRSKYKIYTTGVFCPVFLQKISYFRTTCIYKKSPNKNHVHLWLETIFEKSLKKYKREVNAMFKFQTKN